ncbi:MAG TPA: hypothetical protein VMT71_13070 [Syntrophorhabdales bacterium]|nr:hypothetical protein [Syntrophorhabdales bacterium]
MNTRSIDMEAAQREDRLAIERAAEIIRATSQSGALASTEKIRQALVDEQIIVTDESETESRFRLIIERTFEENEDLVSLENARGELHFISTRFMSEAYGGILMRKQSGPLTLIAELVRENSALYPRPVPLNVFKDSPFELTDEEIQSCLSNMALKGSYEDIKETRSSLGTVFLYSALHLEADYATMLAEWIDVGQASNP